MTTENVRIAVRDAQDSQTLTFMDNSSPNAIHFDQADLTRFFEGDSTVLQMRFNKRHDRANVIREGSKLAFVYKGKDYWLNIITAKDVSHQRELMAFSLSLELNKEKIGFYAANTAMSFVEYLKSIDFEQTLTIGINEIADKKLKLDWDGDQSKLGRLYSLANKFDAEISFETILNDDYSLKQQIINIYKKHDESNQGIGQDKTATTLRVGKDLKVINRSASLENFYSAIRGTGKDGISINDIEFEELDANGNVLYFSKKGQDVIWAPQARDAFPSKNNPGNDGYLVEKKGETEYTTVEALKGYLLSELKKNSSVYVDYETEGHFDSDPGDTFSLEDSVYYNPPLYLEARVYEQTESLVLGVTSSDRTTFTNFVQKESEISNDLLARMRKLIEANKVFTYDIITSDGVTFKNGFGSTTLTARVRDGIKDVTDTFSLKWYKDGTLFSNTKTVTINAADIEEKAVFRFEVADDSGNVRGGAEVTVTNIDDGKKGEPGETYYPHRGYLMADGTFTKIYPNENLIVGSISPSSLVGTNSANQGMYPYRFSFGALKNIPAKLGDAVVIAYDWEVLGDDVAGTFLPQFGNTPYSIANRESFTVTNTNKKGTSSFITSVAASWLASTAVAVNLGFRADNLKGTLKITNFRFLISDVDSGWLPSPSEDYENAYPKYEGFYSDTNVEGSDNPDDYKPWKPFMGPQGKDGYTPVKNVDYFDGQPGQNGKSAYLWIR
ncbi:phage tail protein, partial [Enterococcus casseliflavus]|nr:phage tail protein [Enterococcus casseliflavus]